MESIIIERRKGLYDQYEGSISMPYNKLKKEKCMCDGLIISMCQCNQKMKKKVICSNPSKANKIELIQKHLHKANNIDYSIAYDDNNVQIIINLSNK